MTPLPEFLTVLDAAGLLRCSPKTIRRRIANGLIDAVIEGRQPLIRRSAYLDYIHRLAAPGQSPGPANPKTNAD